MDSENVMLLRNKEAQLGLCDKKDSLLDKRGHRLPSSELPGQQKVAMTNLPFRGKHHACEDLKRTHKTKTGMTFFLTKCNNIKSKKSLTVKQKVLS